MPWVRRVCLIGFVAPGDLSVADGMPLVWLGRLLGIPLAERVAGSTLFERLRADAEQPLSVYFFGGPRGCGGRGLPELERGEARPTLRGFSLPGLGSLGLLAAGALVVSIGFQ